MLNNYNFLSGGRTHASVLIPFLIYREEYLPQAGLTNAPKPTSTDAF